MKRWITSATAAIAACVAFTAFAADRPRRVGCLFVGLENAATRFCNTVRAGLRERGWKDQGELFFVITQNWFDKLPDTARDLVNRDVDVIVASDYAATKAVVATGTKVPIVAVGVSDFVSHGFAKSDDMPGGNVSGVSSMPTAAAIAKSMTDIRMIKARMQRLGILFDPADRTIDDVVRALWESAARDNAMTLRWLGAASQPGAREAALSNVRDQVDAVLVVSLLHENAIFMDGVSARYRVPFIGLVSRRSQAGPLLALQADPEAMCSQSAGFVDRVLKGAKIGSLPIERSDRYRLVIDLRVAGALGLEVPRELAARAQDTLR